MANILYPKFKENVISKLLDLTEAGADVYRAVLVDTGVYTYNAAHNDYADLSGIVGTESGVFASKTVLLGVFDADDITFSSVSGAESEALIIFLDTGTAGNDLLVAYIDTATGLPVTPNGGDITVQWPAAGIFAL